MSQRRGLWAGLFVAAAALVALCFWLFTGEPTEDGGGSAQTSGASESAEAELKFERKASTWDQPIAAKGELVVSGRVLDAKGAAVPNAVVTATAMHGDDVLSDLECKCDNECGQKLLECGCPESSTQLVEHVQVRTGEAPPLARTKTDAEGRFVLSGLAAGEVALWADAPSSIGFRPMVTVGDTAADVRVENGRRVKGKVKTGDDKPASGALVTAIYATHSRFFDATAREDGSFELGPLPSSGVIAVVAMKDEYLPASEHVRDESSRWRKAELSLELHVPRSLSGSVTRDGVPVSGVEVSVEGEHKKKKVKSDDQGQFRVSGLRPGSYELSAEHHGDIARAKASIERTLDKEGVGLELSRGYFVRGTVKDGAGRPVEGAWVFASGFGGASERVKSGPDGSYELPALAPGEWRISVSEDRHLHADDQRVTLTSADVRADFTLSLGSPVSGTVVDARGTPVADAEVSAVPAEPGAKRMGDSTSSGDGGTFTLARLSPGSYTLTAGAEGFVFTTLTAVAPSSDLRVVLSEGSTVTGTVLEADGRPVRGSVVSVDARDDARVNVNSRETKTDEAGRFSIKGLPGMKARVYARANDASADEAEEDFEPSGRFGSAEVVVPKDGTVEVRITLPEAKTVSGLVVDEHNAPIAEASVSARSVETADPTQYGMGRAKSGVDGRFVVEGLVAGPVELSASKKGFMTLGQEEVAATAGQQNVVLRLRRMSEVVGRVVNDTGAPVTEFRLRRETFRAADGRFALPVAFSKTQSEVYLPLEADGFASTLITVAKFSGRKDVGDVRLTRGRTLSGVVVDAVSGAPVAGALVGVVLSASQTRLGVPAERAGSVRTDPKGRFKLERVDERAASLLATHRDYVAYDKPLDPRATELEVRMEAGATLDFTVLSRDGKPAVGSVVLRDLSGRSNLGGEKGLRDGRLTVRGLIAGSYYARFFDYGEGPAAVFRPLTLTVAANEVKAITWRQATDGAEVELVVTGQPDVHTQVILVPGAEAATVPFDKLRELSAQFLWFDKDRKLSHLLPGSYTLLIYRKRDVARSVVTVSNDPKQRLTVPYPTTFESPPPAVAEEFE